MKYKERICFSLLAVGCLAFVYAQDIEKEQDPLLSNDAKFITYSEANAILPSASASGGTIAGNANTVFIQQIGNDNSITSKITAKFSDIRLIQNGSHNSIDIDETSKEINKLITQNGDHNSVVDFSFNPDISTNLDLIQDGNNLTFERFGTNELSKNIKFRMSGDAKTIIIRSF